MSPPSFIRCSYCHKEFGSRSIQIHAPQCVIKWRLNNNKLSRPERQRTPSPPNGVIPIKMLTSSASDENLNNSWPNARKQEHRPRSSSQPAYKRIDRPSTATLPEPKVLDVSLRDTIDMSEMSREMAERLFANNDIGSSDYSSDFTCSTSNSSLSSASLCDNNNSSSEEESQPRKRPSTIRLPRQTRHISVPVINGASSRYLPRRGRTATIRTSLPLSNRLMIAEDILMPRQKIQIPEPCQTCGKEQNPERFHTHPEILNQEVPTKDKQSKPKNSSKTAVIKPTALKFKSRGLEKSGIPRVQPKASSARPTKLVQDRRNRAKKIRQKLPPKPEEPTNNTVPLKDFIQQKHKQKEKIPREPLVQIVDRNPAAERKNLEYREKEFERKIKAMSEQEGASYKLPASGDSRPTRMCYICGREFGSKSLGIHEPKCLEKWKRENEKLPAHQRREEPIRPEEGVKSDEWNDSAWKAAQSNLVPCERCGRTFFPERLEVHLRGCKHPEPKNKKSQAAPSKKSESPTPGLFGGRSSARPMIVCYLCGREFGSKSITIHEPQCLIKWNKENDKLPDHLKRDPPNKPEVKLDGKRVIKKIYKESGEVDREAMAAAAWNSHLETLVKCEGCGRTFFPDRLTVHQKSCLKE